jgi:DNA-binding beta-propeller fold protein YncE
MTLGTAPFTYTWHDHFITLPDGFEGKGQTHSVAVTRGGDILVLCTGKPGLLVCDAAGHIKDSWGDFPEGHGLAIVEEDGRELVWIVNTAPAHVGKYTLDGELLQELPAPPADEVGAGGDVPMRQKFVPTWLAVAADGGLFLADGYGSHQIFRYDAAGNYLGKLDGTEGAGRFNEPHGIRFSPKNELFITDRSNLRVCVYDAEGRYLRHSDTACHSPADFAFDGAGRVYVAEIAGSVKVLDEQLNVLADLGQHEKITPQTSPGTWAPDHDKRPASWPNPPRSEQVPGQFHTPHGLAVTAAGDVIVGEWIEGGRVTKLAKK